MIRAVVDYVCIFFSAPSADGPIKDILADGQSVHQSRIKKLQLTNTDNFKDGYYVRLSRGNVVGEGENGGDATGQQQQVLNPHLVPKQYIHFVVSMLKYYILHPTLVLH